MKIYPFYKKERIKLALFITFDILCIVAAFYFRDPIILFTSVQYFYWTNKYKAERMQRHN